MPSRAEIALRARMVGVDPATIQNDSVLLQRTIYYEKNATQTTGGLDVQTLTSDATAPDDGDTVTVGSVVYRFKTTPAQAYDVAIGASAAIALDNLKAAINETGTPGTEYYAGTFAHPQVTATTNTDTTQVVSSRNKSVRNIATTETSAHLSWGAATTAGGAPGISSLQAGSVEGVSGGQPI